MTYTFHSVTRKLTRTYGNFSTLKDSFGRFHNYLRISLTEKCNLRCSYCMPVEGVSLTPREELLTLEEFKTIIRVFTTAGVDKIRFTGGEPTSSKYLKDLITYTRTTFPSVKSIGITTNGVLLGNQLADLTAAGLTHVNVSLDTLDPKRFEIITRRDSKNIYKVLSAIYNAISIDLKVKINCVIMRGVNTNEMSKFIALAKEIPVDIRFIEVMPFDQNQWSKQSLVGYFEMIDILKEQGYLLTKQSTASVDPHDTTKWYTVTEPTVHLGRIGFISSMSSHFCGGCNRLRITADGKLKTCLFGSDETNIRTLLRSGHATDDSLLALVHRALSQKHWSLGGHATPEALAENKNRPMILIGG